MVHPFFYKEDTSSCQGYGDHDIECCSKLLASYCLHVSGSTGYHIGHGF